MKFEITNLSCGYRKGKPVLRDVSMELSEGDICCILGPNGVGKTTLFKTILGMLPPIGGRICIDGEDISRWKDRRRARTMAYVAQTHVPAFPYLAEEIAMMGRLGLVSRFSEPTRHDYEVVERALDAMGIDYLKGRPYTDISGGERQLLMIARALVQEPDLLILDEPTANLDFGNMARVLSRLKKLSREGLCVIFTSHLPDQAFQCEAKTALLLRGEPMLFGSCEHIVTAKNLERAYHTPVQVAEIVDEDGHLFRMAAPKLREMADGW